MSSSGLEATEQELDAFAAEEDDATPDEGDDDSAADD